MTFGVQADEPTSFAILDRAFAAGVDFFDIADVYPLGGGTATAGRTEEIIGRWLKERGVRPRIFLATKCRGKVGEGVNDVGLSRFHIQRAVEASLRRLQTDVIDLYQTHFFDPFTPIDETLRALDDLVRAGKVRYVGCSNYPLYRLAEAERIARELGSARYETLQPRYNLLFREIERELLPLCFEEGVGVIPYNPIAGGMLSGKYRAGEAPRAGPLHHPRRRRGVPGPLLGRAAARGGRGAGQGGRGPRARAGLGGGGLGAGAAGDHLGDHRREPTRPARRDPRRGGARARSRPGQALRRRLVAAPAPAGQ
jgi:aryl-alcohol dehydrogenase-like predicted oxidoreductase